MCGLGGSPDTVDDCAASQTSVTGQACAQPGGHGLDVVPACSAASPHFGGPGTLMSYCRDVVSDRPPKCSRPGWPGVLLRGVEALLSREEHGG